MTVRAAGRDSTRAPAAHRHGGAHCETAALHKVLAQHGTQVSEPLLFGLGGGISFMHMPAGPEGRAFVGGRNGPFPDFTRRMTDGLGLPMDVVVPADPATAWQDVRGPLDRGEPVIVYGDLFHLPYYQATRHFGAHAFVLLGHDPDARTVTVSDRCRTARTLTLDELAAARGSEHPPFPPRYAWLRADWAKAREPSEDAVRRGVRASCDAMLNPVVPTFGLRGLAAYGAGLDHFVRKSPAADVVAALGGAYVDFELAGTGGCGFRVMFADFLTEAAARTADPALERARPLARNAVDAWHEFLALLLPSWTPAFTELRDTLNARDQHLLRGSPQDQDAARTLGSHLPGLRSRAAGELDPLRAQLAGELRAVVRRVVEAEQHLFDVLKEV
ncbi:BtrH N-terminal domain-containing protein [Streptomyces sp. NPDC087440]|uniref:BtrH N-terminal domain-containing protein n=1 Tax=Streptomyces sp. NPDC087440 TaxID=3365790 RepID=UPI003820B0DE